MKNNVIFRGDVVWVDMNDVFPNGKHYQKGSRPGVVISNDFNNIYSSLIQIIPLTTKEDNLPMHEAVYYRGRKNYCIPEQMMTMDKKYIKNVSGRVSHVDMLTIEKCVKLQLGLESKE